MSYNKSDYTVRAKAPLRIGFAGGGTDVSPYSDIYGGYILNATVNLYAYASIKPLNNGKIILNSIDTKQQVELDAEEFLELTGKLDLLKGVYNRIVKDFINKPLSFELSTYVDVPAGSGLGSSSTLVIAILSAFSEWLKIPFGEYDIAHLAWDIERNDLEMTGGKQDQYAAAFGGFNFMEFYGEKVIVNPLRIKNNHLNELEHNLILYFTGKSRISSEIINTQINNMNTNNTASIEAMHGLKEQAVNMKECILKGNLSKMGEILNFGWEHKKQMAKGITNSYIDEIYEAAIKAGAEGGKVSGAGGGGFIIFYCPQNTRYKVIEALNAFEGKVQDFKFTQEGVQTWKV